jgi:hypothetical protein
MNLWKTGIYFDSEMPVELFEPQAFNRIDARGAASRHG